MFMGYFQSIWATLGSSGFQNGQIFMGYLQSIWATLESSGLFFFSGCWAFQVDFSVSLALRWGQYEPPPRTDASCHTNMFLL